MYPTVKTTYIYSAFRPERTEEENLKLHEAEKAHLRLMPIQFEEVEGMWEGQLEKSLMIELPFNADDVIGQRAFGVDQEAFLKIHSDGTTELKYSTGKNAFVGKWQAVEAPTKNYTKTKKGFFQAL